MSNCITIPPLHMSRNEAMSVRENIIHFGLLDAQQSGLLALCSSSLGHLIKDLVAEKYFIKYIRCRKICDCISRSGLNQIIKGVCSNTRILFWFYWSSNGFARDICLREARKICCKRGAENMLRASGK